MLFLFSENHESMDDSTQALLPLERAELLMILAFAMRKIPGKPRGFETPDQADVRVGQWASQVADHLAKCGVLAIRRPLAPSHKTPSNGGTSTSTSTDQPPQP